MAGRTPWEASRAFFGPLRIALSCIATAKITTSSGGCDALGKVHSWSINGGEGVPLRGGYRFEAGMTYEIIKVDDDTLGPFKISTQGYLYSLYDKQGNELFGIHWHPGGSGGFQAPHVHFGSPVLSPQGPLPAKHHLPTPRMTFETAIRWAIEHGAEPIQADWQNRLTLAETPHLLYRSWHQSPDEAASS